MLELTVDLKGTLAVVTAAAGSIGGAITRTLARCGATLALNDVNDSALAMISEEVDGFPLYGSAAEYSTVHKLVDRVVTELGAPFILVNVAGKGQMKDVVAMSEAEWDEVQNLNLKSVFNWCHALLPHMLQGAGGRIINISSVAGKKGGHSHKSGQDSRAAYASAKAGVMGFTRGLALEVAPKVTVNAICPGLVPNPRNRVAVEVYQSRLEDYILGRVGTGEDIAKAVLYFIASDWVTGEITDVNGGFYID